VASDDVGIRGEHELMQPCEKRAMFKRPGDERVLFLFEWQIDADTNRLDTFGP
jgi:hypothetical protein